METDPSSREINKRRKTMKKEILEILEKREYSKLGEIGSIKKTLSILISFLYKDELYMFRAAEAIGYLCYLIHREDPESAREIIRRMFWYMNDENGGYCMGAPIVIGEIGRLLEESFSDFINPTASLIENNELEVKYVVYALGRIGRKILEARINLKDKLFHLLDHPDPSTRAYTIKTIQELKIAEAIPKLKTMLSDTVLAKIYDSGYIEEVRISDLSSQAIKRLEALENKPHNVS